MKLAIAQMVLGVLIVGLLWIPWLFGLPPCWVLGVSVLGCAIAQFLKAREARIKCDATP